MFEVYDRRQSAEAKRSGRRQETLWIRPYVPGEDLRGVALSRDRVLCFGDLIACVPGRPSLRWHMTRSYFMANYQVSQSVEGRG